jgi:hypothetical protein
MDITTLWRNHQCPFINGIYYANGNVTEMHIDESHTSVVVEKRTTLHEMLTKAPEDLSAIDAFTEIDFVRDGTNYTAHAGGGSHGSDGFMCLTQNNAVIWIAFFDSNEFMAMKYKNNHLHAVNNWREEWVFPVDAPENITINKAHVDHNFEITHEAFYVWWRNEK